MKRPLLSLLLCTYATARCCADTLATSAATLELGSPSCKLSPQLFTPDWQLQRATGALTSDADAAYPFRLEGKGAGVIRGRAFFVQTATGAVEATYTFTPEHDASLNALFVGMSLPADMFAGGSWRMDGRGGTFPAENRGLAIAAGAARSLTVTARSGKEQATFVFPELTNVMLQDDRQWGPTFSLRVGHSGTTRTFTPAEPFTVRFTLATHEPQRLVLDAPVTLQAGPDWIPLRHEPDILPGSALDFSALGFCDAPAGKHGRVVARGPHFEFEKRPGVAQRFYGVNLCFTANYLDPEASARLAARLARTGYNALRIHHHDGGLVEGSKDGTTVNPAQLARLHALIAACASNGLYVTTDLYVSRSVPWRSIGVEREGRIEMNEYKMLVPVHDGAWNNLKLFTRQWLDPVNPRTGHRAADEPALAWLSMINEGNFGNYMREMRRIPEWQQAWGRWLSEKRLQDPRAYADIPAALPTDIYGQNRHTTAFLLFLQDMERHMLGRMKSFLRDELRCRALVTNRNAWSNHASDQVSREDLYDYVDDHFYVDHPEFIERPWQLPSMCANANPIRNPAVGAQRAVFNRLLNKPFTITEFNYSAPGRFRGVGGILAGAMGALQDWSGIWRFAYSHSAETVTRPEGTALNYFDMAADPLSQAAERASLCLFLRGDLPPLTRTYALLLPRNEVLQMRDRLPQNHTSWPWLAWQARLGTQVANAPPPGATWCGRFPEVYGTPSDDIRKLLASAASDSRPAAEGEALQLDPESGTIILRTARTCGGFTEKGRVDAGALSFDVGETAATVWVSSLDSRPIRASSRLLLTHLTDVQNSGIRYAQSSRKTLLAWGGVPHLVRNGKAEIRLAVAPAKDYKIYALSANGRRRGVVSSGIVETRLAFTAAVDGQPDSATMLYEVVRE